MLQDSRKDRLVNGREIWELDDVGTPFSTESILGERAQSLLECRKCKADGLCYTNVSYILVQQRSLDEGMTIKATCKECGCKWNE